MTVSIRTVNRASRTACFAKNLAEIEPRDGEAGVDDYLPEDVSRRGTRREPGRPDQRRAGSGLTPGRPAATALLPLRELLRPESGNSGRTDARESRRAAQLPKVRDSPAVDTSSDRSRRTRSDSSSRQVPRGSQQRVELIDGQACLPDDGTQSTLANLAMIRHCVAAARRGSMATDDIAASLVVNFISRSLAQA